MGVCESNCADRGTVVPKMHDNEIVAPYGSCHEEELNVEAKAAKRSEQPLSNSAYSGRKDPSYAAG